MSEQQKITTYLLHFAQPIEHVRHYLGSCETGRLTQRMQEHAAGKGAKLTAEACRRGISWTVAATWLTADRSLERHMKKIRHYRRKCPICQNAAQGLGLFTVTPKPNPATGATAAAISWPSSKKGILR